MDLVAFCVAALATWRLAHFFYAEDGPWRAALRLRQMLGARQIDVFACFLCVSVWSALPAALLAGTGWRQIVLLWPALSAVAILVERVAFPDTFIDMPEFSEEQETSDVLRQE
jgi:hypothetical protein